MIGSNRESTTSGANGDTGPSRIANRGAEASFRDDGANDEETLGVDPRALPINPTNNSGTNPENFGTSKNPPLFHMDLSGKMGASSRVVHKLRELCISCGLELVENNVNSALAQLRGVF